MKLQKSNFSRLLKSPHISIILGISLLYFIYNVFHIYSLLSIDNDALYGVSNTQTYCFVLFIAFLYVSYEYVYTYKNSDIEETIASNESGKFRSYVSMFITLFIFVLFIYAISILIGFITALSASIHNPVFYWHILLTSTLNFLILLLIAVFTGGFLAIKFKRIAAYSILILLVFFMSSAPTMFLQLLSYNTNINFFNFQYFFEKILPQNTNVITDYQYGVSCELYRWNLSLFWLLLLVGLIIFTLCNKKNMKSIVAICICFILAFLNLLGYFQGGSRVLYDNSLDSISTYDSIYYEYTQQKNKAADFSISKYDMTLTAIRDAYLNVNMEIDERNNNNEYYFTLYRDFVIDSITDETGQILEWNREGDYFSVKCSSETEKINLKYKGKSNIFFSNLQGISLPGCFPYYPIAGYHILNDTMVDTSEAGNTIIWGMPGYLPISNGFESVYNIKVNTLLTVYSNLKSSSEHKNEFTGKAQYPTLMSGLIEKKSKKYNSYTLISLPDENKINDDALDSLQYAINEYENEHNTDKHLDLSEISVFQTSAVFNWASYSEYFSLNDHIFLSNCNESSIKEIATILVKEYNKYA
ncbi:MAG: hypothetical protein ACI4HO_03045 [Ruminococcus sp.]